MNKTLAVLQHEFNRTVRRKGYIIVTMAFPLLGLLGMLAFQLVQVVGVPQPQARTVGYVDETGIFGDFREQKDVTFVRFEDEGAARTALLNKDVSEYYTIPANYMATGLVQRYVMQREMEASPAVKDGFNNFVMSNLLADKVSDELSTRLKSPALVMSWRLDETGAVNPSAYDFGRIIVPFLFGILLATSIFGTSGYLLQSITEEKENRVIEVLLSSVSTRQLLAGKVLGLGAVGLLQIIVWLAFARLGLAFFASRLPLEAGLSLSGGLLALIIAYFVLGYLFFAVLMAGLGSVISTVQEGSQIAGVFTAVALSPFWVVSAILTRPDHIVFKIMTYFPLTAPVTAIVRMGVTDLPVWELGLSLAILTASIIGGMALVSRIFRVYLLMYGKRPGLRELWHSLVKA